MFICNKHTELSALCRKIVKGILLRRSCRILVIIKVKALFSKRCNR